MNGTFGRLLRDAVFIIVGLAVVLWFLNIRLPGSAPKGEPQPPLRTVDVQINNESFRTEVAETSEQRDRALSFRPSLGRNEAMLLVFPSARPQRMWMYGMNFPLDMVFIRDGLVVDYEENIPPPSATLQDPAVVTILEEADSVLYIPAGRAKELDIRIGTEVVIDGE